MLKQDSETGAGQAATVEGGGRLRAALGAWRFPGPFFWGAVLLCLLVLLPAFELAPALWSPDPEVWPQVRPRLPGLFYNSLGLVAGVVAGSGVLGTGLAWLTALNEFPGRRFFSWALLLPLAVPAYVLGFVVVGLLDAGGPVHGAWLALQGENAGFLSVRSSSWLVASLSLSFYPCAYLPARHAFQNQAGRAMEAARALGAGPYRAFFRVGLPVAMPWIGAGLALVAMEALADIATVSLFRYETLSVAIYQAWGSAASWPVAAQLAGFLLLPAFTALLLEHRQRGRQGRCPSPAYAGGLAPFEVLNASPNFAASLCAALVLGLAFALPVVLLLFWSLQALALDMAGGFAAHALHSVCIALGGAGMVAAAALALGLARRAHALASIVPVRLATIGYAMPGAALAAGMLAAVADVGKRLAGLFSAPPDFDFSWLLGGGLGALLLAYLVRFLAVGFAPADSALQRVTPNLVESAHVLGVYGVGLWRQVYWPLLRGGLLGSFLLVFVEILRELQVILLVRPAGWDGLALRVFESALAGQWQQAALPGLVLVLAGLLPIFFLVRGTEYWHGRA